jgi:hypothetical protein
MRCHDTLSASWPGQSEVLAESDYAFTLRVEMR